MAGDNLNTPERPNISFARRVLIAVGIFAAAAVAALLVGFAHRVLLLLFAGLLFGIFLQWCQRRIMRYTRLPAGVALGITFVLWILCVGGILTILLPVVVEQSGQMLEEVTEEFSKIRYSLLRYSWGREVVDKTDDAGELLMGLDSESALKTFQNVIGIFSTTFGAVFSILFILAVGVYMAADMPLYFNGVIRLIPMGYRRRAGQILDRMGNAIRWWLLWQTLTMITLATIVFLCLMMIGIPYALVLALLAAIFTFIPKLGLLIAFIPTILIAGSTNLVSLIFVIGLYLGLLLLEHYLFTPLLQRHITILPAVVILGLQAVLLVLVGIIGVILAVPLTVCLMILGRMIYIEDILKDHERPLTGVRP